MSNAAAVLPDVESAPLPDDHTTRRIADLATRQEQLERWIASYETVTAALQEELTAIREHELPNAMAQAGVDEIKLTGGRKVTVSTRYFAGIRSQWPAEHRERGFQYLIKNGAGALVRHDITTTFGHGDSKAARSLLSYIRKQGWLKRFVVNDKTWVHSGQLAAWVGERLRRDLPVDMEILDAQEKRISTISTPPREVL